eukprot:3528145-Prymnesium_polylepis.1
MPGDRSEQRVELEASRPSRASNASERAARALRTAVGSIQPSTTLGTGRAEGRTGRYEYYRTRRMARCPIGTDRH